MTRRRADRRQRSPIGGSTAPGARAGLQRRDVLKLAGMGVAAAGIGSLLSACELIVVPSADYGPLQAFDGNGLALPAGFTSRVVATTGQVVPGTSYVWHADPDGGACFPAAGGGWIYANNSETSSAGGGVSMIRFDSSGAIVEARSCLSGTTRNCAGGATPWGTWLSCEETATGRVWEVDPTGVSAAVARPAMGRFNHEAVAVDEVHGHLYLTEDNPTGGLYRFTPTAWPDLSSGLLEVLTESGGTLGWATVPDPDGSPTATRSQVPSMKPFNGGEGITFADPLVAFTTKGDNRVWGYNVQDGTLTVIYDDDTSPTPSLTGADNVESRSTSPAGTHFFVAEDGGNMELVAVALDGTAYPFCRIDTTGSEVTGPAFSPDGTRLYFNSQRNPGRTYEVTGPFLPRR